MEDSCKFEDKIIEMHGDIKKLVAEFKAMNGILRDTKVDFEKHKDESKIYRKQIEILWVALNSFKWMTIFLFGSGCLWKLLEFVMK